MRWSKLKQITEARFAPRVRGRVRIWTTEYRYDLSGLHTEGRSWITVDGETVVNMHRHQTAVAPDGGYVWLYSGDRHRHNVHDRYDLLQAAWAMQTLSINAALASSDGVMRALALLDARVGVRRLRDLDPADEKPLAATLLAFRQGVERVAAPARR